MKRELGQQLSDRLQHKCTDFKVNPSKSSNTFGYITVSSQDAIYVALYNKLPTLFIGRRKNKKILTSKISSQPAPAGHKSNQRN